MGRVWGVRVRGGRCIAWEKLSETRCVWRYCATGDSGNLPDSPLGNVRRFPGVTDHRGHNRVYSSYRSAFYLVTSDAWRCGSQVIGHFATGEGRDGRVGGGGGRSELCVYRRRLCACEGLPGGVV